jgi:hypothetical protein
MTPTIRRLALAAVAGLALLGTAAGPTTAGRGQGIAYVPYFPLGGWRPLQSDVLASVAARLGASPMSVALAWLLRRSPNILLIPRYVLGHPPVRERRRRGSRTATRRPGRPGRHRRLTGGRWDGVLPRRLVIRVDEAKAGGIPVITITETLVPADASAARPSRPTHIRVDDGPRWFCRDLAEPGREAAAWSAPSDAARRAARSGAPDHPVAWPGCHPRRGAAGRPPVQTTMQGAGGRPR